MIRKFLTLLLVSIITLGVSYGGYASPPAGAKKPGIVTKLGNGVLIALLGISISTSGLLMWKNSRLTDRYETSLAEVRALQRKNDSYRDLLRANNIKFDFKEMGSLVGPSYSTIEEFMKDVLRNHGKYMVSTSDD